jgi:hypothetical protein
MSKNHVRVESGQGKTVSVHIVTTVYRVQGLLPRIPNMYEAGHSIGPILATYTECTECIEDIECSNHDCLSPWKVQPMYST